MARLGLYQPFIEDRNVRRLYQLKVTHHARTGRKLPMTALVNRILDDFFDQGSAAGRPVPASSLSRSQEGLSLVLSR